MHLRCVAYYDLQAPFDGRVDQLLDTVVEAYDVRDKGTIDSAKQWLIESGWRKVWGGVSCIRFVHTDLQSWQPRSYKILTNCAFFYPMGGVLRWGYCTSIWSKHF